MTLHFPSPGVGYPGGLCISSCVPSCTTPKAQLLSISLIWERAQSQEHIQLGHSALGKTKKSHMGKRETLGKKRSHRESDTRRRGGRGGSGRRPEQKEQRKIPGLSPPSYLPPP